MKPFACLAAALLLFVAGAQAGCVRVDNQDLIEYSCEGGSIEDLRDVPDNAEKIRISNMPVGRLTDSLFSRFGSKLVVLTCSHCLITDIDDTAFRRLENLQQLSLDNNQLKEVRAAWFEGLAYLTYLDLNYNSIERVDGDVFRNTPELVDLRVSGNRLTCLDVASMSRLKDLKRIFLNENPSFACPNAVKRFLNDRQIDFEADPHWATMSEDRVQANSPAAPPMPPTEQEYRERPPTPPTYYTRPPWTPSEPAPTPPTLPPTPEPTPAPTPARRPYVPEMIQPSAPVSDFSLQGPYYAPKVNQQQIDEYRNTLAQQAQNATQAAVNKTAAVAATVTPPSVPVTESDMTTTTECPNAAVALSRDSFLVGLGLLVLSAHRWTAEIL